MEQVLDYIIPLLHTLLSKYPLTSSIIAVVGTLRIIFKPLMTFLHAYVQATPGKSDDLKLEKVEASKIYKTIVFLVDYFTSYKIKK